MVQVLMTNYSLQTNCEISQWGSN